MAKVSGGTRNYGSQTSAYKKRKREYDAFSKLDNFDAERSAFYEGGGYVVTDISHNKAKKDKDGVLRDLSQYGVEQAAKHGYRVFQDAERSYKLYDPTPDGRFESYTMDVKTINVAGNNTIKAALEKAAKQGTECVMLVPNTKAMTRTFVEGQIEKFITLSPKSQVSKIKLVVVVGQSGNIHRHKLK